jgi:hypothetical protein
MGDSGQATAAPADAGGADDEGVDTSEADSDASAGLDRVATLATTGCALVLATFATVELVALGPRLTTWRRWPGVSRPRSRADWRCGRRGPAPRWSVSVPSGTARSPR